MGYIDKFASATRKVMHKIHLKQIIDSGSKKRIQANLTSPNYLKLPEDFFVQRICVDLGCGSNAAGAANLLRIGAKFVNLVDVDQSFIEPASTVLNETKSFKGRWKTYVADATQLPFETGSIDFVLCQGVLHHIDNEKAALSEIFRVLSPNGKCYISVIGSGGLVGEFVSKTMRDEYKKNLIFRNFINKKLNLKDIHQLLNDIKNKITNDNSESYIQTQIFLDSLTKLIDNDLLLTIEDRVLAPIYRQSTESEYLEKLKEAGFTSSYRVSKCPDFSNIRKIVAPFYKDYTHPIAKILFGDGGSMNFVVSK